jgi:tetraacyldisaccharide 4'-kinase
MHSSRIAEWLWYGEGRLARLARLGLAPLEAVYASVVALRGALYAVDILSARKPRVPAVSVGNLEVGGTGKTPIAAWIAQQLACRGASPAVVLRGYGGDEPLVHARLNPAIRIVVSADRRVGVARAAELGADVAVLDDAFQHRRVRRAADVVLVSAERWTSGRRLLPAGPLREPPTALRRATAIVVTRRMATAARADDIAGELRRIAPRVPQAQVYLALSGVCDADSGRAMPLTMLDGSRVLAISAIGDPESFVGQLVQAGADVRAANFPDHYAFAARDAQRLANAVEDGMLAVCTLKDAVKLAPLWPRQAPQLWYVSQRIDVEGGHDVLDAALTAVLRARHLQP